MPTCPICGESYQGDLAYCPECRSAPQPASGDERDAQAARSALEAELLELLAAGNKTAAIKRYRERTGAGLAEAKRAIEEIESPPQPVDSDLEARLLSLLRDNRKIEAIRLYREQTHCQLKEAKDAVDALQRKYRIATKGGCAGVVLVALVCSVAWLAAGR